MIMSVTHRINKLAPAGATELVPPQDVVVTTTAVRRQSLESFSELQTSHRVLTSREREELWSREAELSRSSFWDCSGAATSDIQANSTPAYQRPIQGCTSRFEMPRNGAIRS